MARITVEDCIDKFPSCFELVLIASNRARKLYSGDTPTVEKDNDKNTVIALREIADETITSEDLKKDLIEEYQTTTLNDDEELQDLEELEESDKSDKTEFLNALENEDNAIVEEQNELKDDAEKNTEIQSDTDQNDISKEINADEMKDEDKGVI